MSRKYRITEIRFSPCELEKWMHQNKAEYVECEEGCLLDNLFVACKRGYAAIYENARNAWTSDYYVEFAPYKNDIACKVLWNKWERFVKASQC